MAHPSRDRMIADGGVEFHAEYTTVPEVHDIFRTLAIVENIPTTELDPLYNHVDIEALTQLVSHANAHDCTVGVEFTFGDLVVVVDENQTIRIHDENPRIVESDDKSKEMH